MTAHAQTDRCQITTQPKKQKYDLLLLTARAVRIQDVLKIYHANETSLYCGSHYLP